MANQRDLSLTEQVSVLVAPETKERIDALVSERREAGHPWPDYSQGAVVRDILDAGLPTLEKKAQRAQLARARRERRT